MSLDPQSFPSSFENKKRDKYSRSNVKRMSTFDVEFLIDDNQIISKMNLMNDISDKNASTTRNVTMDSRDVFYKANGKLVTIGQSQEIRKKVEQILEGENSNSVGNSKISDETSTFLSPGEVETQQQKGKPSANDTLNNENTKDITSQIDNALVTASDEKASSEMFIINDPSDVNVREGSFYVYANDLLHHNPFRTTHSIFFIVIT